MSESLASTAEVLKLARLLGRDPGSLEYLERVDPADLRLLREQVMETLFSANAPALGRLAAASKLLPVGVTAAIAERALGPMLTARLAGLLEPARAVDVAAKLPASFLAEVAIELDPRRAPLVVAQIPPAQIAAATEVLVARGEHVTIGEFVGSLSKEARMAALDKLDGQTFVRVAFVLADESSLSRMFSDLPPERRPDMVRAAADAGLWAELLELVGRLDEPLRGSYMELSATAR